MREQKGETEDGGPLAPVTQRPSASKRPKEFKFKICLIGDPAVGKTSLIRRFVYNVFSDEYLTTIGTKVSKKEIAVPFEGEQARVKLLIWDIMGQKEFHNLHSLYFQDASGAIVVSDMTRKETLENIANWVSALYDVTLHIPIVLVTNKSDLEEGREVTDDDLMEVAEAFLAPYYFSSAKTGDNVERIFRALVRAILRYSQNKGRGE